ncbi:unnamed protein product [Linum trigynum]|uniref:RRM domain-containing protein n=1 Tax=Linum trigynum TaxID=586398 RepID=A0AAV2G274_9ROSI
MEALRPPFPSAVASEKPAVAIAAFPSITIPNQKQRNTRRLNLFSSSSSSTLCPSVSCSATASATLASTSSSSSNSNRNWMVLVERPPQGLASKPDIVNYFVNTLEMVLGSEKDAQMSIYHVCCDAAQFGFCCDIDKSESIELARLPGVLSVMPDPNSNSTKKTSALSAGLEDSFNPLTSMWLFPPGTSKHWLVRTTTPGIGVVTKAQVVDYYTQILTKVLGNEKDAQMCVYHVSWQSDFGFCCQLDEDSARILAGVPGVLSVQPDENFKSKVEGYGVDTAENSGKGPNSLQAIPPGTKKLFVTGLSFYTSEKTLREAFKVFGELVEVKIIMDKISKRSKGYAFVEYMTEEAASAALREMNGKIINGWLIVVDVAKTKPKKYSRSRPMSPNS